MKFDEVNPPLCPEILQGIETLGFTCMTPVQSATIPLFLTNKDVCVNACTGSGKTLAFVLPMIEMILKHHRENESAHIRMCKLMSLILSPTRELARQIYETTLFFTNSALPNMHVTLLVGGESVDENMDAFRKAKGEFAMIIGTPGRVEDILNRALGSTLDVKDLSVLIMDEADTLLDMGFQQSIDHILQLLPKQRRTGLFSATQTHEVKALARAGLRNPATICVKVTKSEQQTPVTLRNYYAYVSPEEKISHVIDFLSKNAIKKHIVFFSTCAAVDFYGRILPTLLPTDMPCMSLHGKMAPKKRVSTYKAFTQSDTGVLFCTDVVARGIDLPDVDWIVQYDPPTDPNFFVHRVGRTARAGRDGSALMFLAPQEDTYINFLGIRKIPIEAFVLPDTVPDRLPEIKACILQDRDLLEKGTKAFIAFVRSYKEHHCQFIFRFQDLDIGAVARGFALLRLPKMTEFKSAKIEFEFDDTIDVGTIRFKDSSREKQRQRKYTQLLEERAKAEEAKLKRGKPKKEGEVVKAPRRREKKRGRQQQIIDEWDDLAHEEAMYKKMKKGKITKEAYELAVSGKKIEVGSDDDSDVEQTSKMRERLTKREPMKVKTKEQKEELRKREVRIRLRKKRDHIKPKNGKRM